MNKVLSNIRIHDLSESIYASGYSMMATPPTETQFDLECSLILIEIRSGIYSNKHVQRAIKLANAKGGGHNQFLTGILVSFDMTFTNKGWVEAERYRFLNFVSSQSTMHRITKMNIDKCCHEKVDQRIIDIVNEKIDKYNNDKTLENYREVLYNLPNGLKITARMTTNYRCLRNIYEQRHTHRLQEWLDFCEEIRQLPLAEEFIVGTKNG